MMLKRLLAHPLTVGLDIDDPQVTHLRRAIIQDKGFLRRIYHEWYLHIAAALPEGEGPVLELGSGAGFLREVVPDLIPTDVFACQNISAVLDGRNLPFANGVLRAVVMTNVLHHIAQPQRFFAETARCLRHGGRVVMIEPWVTPWSRLIYTRLHHEPFCPEAPEWDFPASGPLSGANGALPWIVFVRDRSQFERQFPHLRIETIVPLMPFRYLVSGGVSLRSVMPEGTFGLWRQAEQMLQPWMDHWAMFAQVVLVRS